MLRLVINTEVASKPIGDEGMDCPSGKTLNTIGRRDHFAKRKIATNRIWVFTLLKSKSFWQ